MEWISTVLDTDVEELLLDKVRGGHYRQGEDCHVLVSMVDMLDYGYGSFTRTVG
jgi:hypothetical protein